MDKIRRAFLVSHTLIQESKAKLPMKMNQIQFLQTQVFPSHIYAGSHLHTPSTRVPSSPQSNASGREEYKHRHGGKVSHKWFHVRQHNCKPGKWYIMRAQIGKIVIDYAYLLINKWKLNLPMQLCLFQTYPSLHWQTVPSWSP